MPATGDTDTIDILAFPFITLILMASVIEPLRAANRISGERLYRWRLLSMDGAPVETTAGFAFPADGAFRPDDGTAALFVVSSYNWADYNTQKVKQALSRAARHRPLIAGIESGTWLMAEAALLDGHRATIHWEDYEDFSARHPDIQTVKERFVIDGKRMTTGGSIPTLDLMLELIRRRHGYSLALEVARSFIYEREGGLRQTLMGPDGAQVAGIDRRVAEALRLMEDSVGAPLALSRIARRVGVSERHLAGLFRNNLDVGPHEHYLALRLNAARRRVIESAAPLAEIAEATGFNSAAAFARAYRTQFGESASETRKRLRG